MINYLLILILGFNIQFAHSQGVWVAKNKNKTIFMIPVMHSTAFKVSWGGPEVDFAINNSDVAYIENSGIEIDILDYPHAVIKEYEKISDKAKEILNKTCAQIQKKNGCYESWLPIFSYIVILNSIGYAESYISSEDFVIKKITNKNKIIIPLESSKNIVSASENTPYGDIIDTINKHVAVDVGWYKKVNEDSTKYLMYGDERGMRFNVNNLTKKLFSEKFYQSHIGERSLNMVRKLLSDHHKNITCVAGYAHFFDEKNGIFNQLIKNNYLISKLKK